MGGARTALSVGDTWWRLEVISNVRKGKLGIPEAAVLDNKQMAKLGFCLFS